MQTVPAALTKWILMFVPLFSKRAWQSVPILLVGAILAVGARTVTSALRVMGLAHTAQFPKYYWIFKPALLGLYSVVTLLAKQILSDGVMPVRTASWYRKQQATFSDTLALVRRWLWSNSRFIMSEKPPDMMKLPRELFERLTDTLSYAA